MLLCCSDLTGVCNVDSPCTPKLAPTSFSFIGEAFTASGTSLMDGSFLTMSLAATLGYDFLDHITLNHGLVDARTPIIIMMQNFLEPMESVKEMLYRSMELYALRLGCQGELDRWVMVEEGDGR